MILIKFKVYDMEAQSTLFPFHSHKHPNAKGVWKSSECTQALAPISEDIIQVRTGLYHMKKTTSQHRDTHRTSLL